MKRQLLHILLILAILCPSMASAADKADDVLARAVQTIKRAPSVTFRFAADNNSGSKVDGTLIVAGNKFVYDTKTMKVWFDGKTQYTLVQSSKEVNITEPTAEELMETNPIAIISSYKGNYTAKVIGKDKKSCTVLLTSKSKHSAVKSAEITINTATNMPLVIKADFGQSNTIFVTVTSAVVGKTLPASTFTFNKKNHPSYTIVDLR